MEFDALSPARKTVKIGSRLLYCQTEFSPAKCIATELEIFPASSVMFLQQTNFGEPFDDAVQLALAEPKIFQLLENLEWLFPER